MVGDRGGLDRRHNSCRCAPHVLGHRPCRRHARRLRRRERPVLRRGRRAEPPERRRLLVRAERGLQQPRCRERDEVGRHRTEPGPVQLLRRRPDRRLRPEPRHDRARPHARVARPAARLGPRSGRERPAAGHARPHQRRRRALGRGHPLLGRGQRSLRVGRLAPSVEPPAAARQQLDRGGVPRRPSRRPERQALLQRLRHRRHQRQEHRDLQHGPRLPVARRADRLRGLPVPPRIQLRHEQLPGEPPALLGPRRRRADHRARRRRLGRRPGQRVPPGHRGVHERRALHRHHHLGHHRPALVARRRDPAAARPQLPEEGGVLRRARRVEQRR